LPGGETVSLFAKKGYGRAEKKKSREALMGGCRRKYGGTWGGGPAVQKNEKGAGLP